MSFGKSSGSSAPVTTEEQKAQLRATTEMLTGTIIPAYKQAVGGAKDTYYDNAQGLLKAAQNQATQAGQIGQTLGETGASAVRTGTAGLERMFTPEYEQQQIAAAYAPAQAQYMQNLAQLRREAASGGVSDSYRQRMIESQLAGQTAAAQQQLGAQVSSNIAAQRLAANQALQQGGASQLGQALGAAGQQVTAAMAPQALYNQYASVLFGTPAASYTPDFRGTQGTNTSGYNAGISFKGISF